MILLDTDICIEILRNNTNVIEQRKKTDEAIAISFMTVAELYYGAEKSKNRIKNINIVDEFVLSLTVIQTDLDILKKFGEIKSGLNKKNILLPDADILIAATAISKCSKLVSGNVKHFKRFESLILESWI